MTIFSPDGRYGYVCSSFTPETVVISTETREIVGRVKQISTFLPEHRGDPRWEPGVDDPEGRRQGHGVCGQAAV